MRSDAMGSFVVRGREAPPASYAEGLLLALVPAAASRGETAEVSAAALVAGSGAMLAPRLACPTASY
jgi:hypothetical protein